MIEIDGVTKTYRGGVHALRGIMLALQPGIVGPLGPNGAGKSTLLRILATLDRPTAGVVRFDGHDLVREPDALRRVLGYLPQDFGVYPHLTGLEFLQFMAAAKGLPGPIARTRIRELLELVNLSAAAGRALGGYSGGMRQRIGIAQALLNDPRVLILDEPTVGLDPDERVRFRQILSTLSVDRVVILSTHIVSDISSTAPRIAILDRGRLIAHDTVDALLRRAAGCVWEALVGLDELGALQQRLHVSEILHRPDGALVRIVSREQPATPATPAMPRLEDAYFLLTREPEAVAA